MPSKIKRRPAGLPNPAGGLQPRQPHEADPRSLAASVDPHHRATVPPSTLRAADHARHHVSRHTQT